MPRAAKPYQKTVVRYRTPDGRQVPKGTPGAKPSREHSSTYYAKVGGVVHALKTTDLGTAWARLRELQRRLADEQAGITDPYTRHARTPLEVHRREWLSAVRASGATAGYVETLGERTGAVCAGWRTAAELNVASAGEALARVAAERDWSAQTRKHAVRALKQFSRWLWRSRRLRGDPLAGLAVPRVHARVRPRRLPEDAEVGRLLAWLEGEGVPVRDRVTGPGRALLYRCAMATGFRAGELRSLTPESVDPARDVVHLGASADKRRRGAAQPVPAWLAAELRAWLAAGNRLWGHLRREQPGRFLRRDLVAAGVEVKRPGPGGQLLAFDFHSLRKWYVSWAANRPNISPKALQELARHADPHITMSVYAESRADEMAQAVGEMPRPGGSVEKIQQNPETFVEIERLRALLRAAGSDPDAPG